MTKKLFKSAPWVMLALVAAANLLLIRQNLQLRQALERYQPRQLAAGEQVPSFSADGLDGAPVNVTYDGGRKKVLLYFTPPCPYCRQQFAYWREMLERVDAGRFEVVGLVARNEDKARLEEYLRAVGCGADSPTPLRVALVTKQVQEAYKLSGTPATVIVSADGRVEKAWPGRWSEAEAPEAGALLGVNFTPRQFAARK